MPARVITVQGQPSWSLKSSHVAANITCTGGHLGPVTFRLHGRDIEPFSIAPWATERHPPGLPAVLRVLRGDFFCLPFGGNQTPYRGERHPIHGETANARWRYAGMTSGNGRHTLHLRLFTRIRPGTVDKRITLIDKQTMVYQTHIISGMHGPMSLGHHAMLRFPDKEASGVVSTSRFIYGQVFAELFERPENKGYSILKPGACFGRLDQVPMITGKMTDVSRYPARRGFEDLVLLAADTTLPLAWSAVTFPQQQYVWFALKNPRLLPETILWISNGGRHYAPWNGRHSNVMGIEEVCGYFHLGLTESSRSNPLAMRNIQTIVTLRPNEPLSIPYAFGVAPIPYGFDRLIDIEVPAHSDAIILRSASGKRVRVRCDYDFLQNDIFSPTPQFHAPQRRIS
ncbi:MAG: hypothetical protein ACP5VQ_07735 [Phycisphaerae bacterium]